LKTLADVSKIDDISDLGATKIQLNWNSLDLNPKPSLRPNPRPSLMKRLYLMKRPQHSHAIPEPKSNHAQSNH